AGDPASRPAGHGTPGRGDTIRGPSACAGPRRGVSWRWSAGNVDELELHAVGIGEEDGVVARRVVVLAGRIQDADAVCLELPGEGVHLRAASCPEGDLAEPDPVLAEPVRGE